jgi:hypothetical protein
MPRIARKPIGIPISQRLANAPTAPKGIPAKTMNGLKALLNWLLSFQLFLQFAHDLESITLRQLSFEVADARHQRPGDLVSQVSRGGKGRHVDRAILVDLVRE